MTLAHAFVTCPGCGKRGFPSRKAAKVAMRASRLRGMSVYRCKVEEFSNLWHWGHLPDPVKESRIPRRALGPSAPKVRAPREPREKG